MTPFPSIARGEWFCRDLREWFYFDGTRWLSGREWFPDYTGWSFNWGVRVRSCADIKWEDQ